MNEFKIGDEVRSIGTSAGNGSFKSATITQTPEQRSDGRYQVLVTASTQLWSVNRYDLQLIDNTAAKAFAERFLSKEGKQLLKDGYIEAKIVASKKMKEEMEVIAVDAFLASIKSK